MENKIFSQILTTRYVGWTLAQWWQICTDYYRNDEQWIEKEMLGSFMDLDKMELQWCKYVNIHGRCSFFCIHKIIIVWSFIKITKVPASKIVSAEVEQSCLRSQLILFRKTHEQNAEWAIALSSERILKPQQLSVTVSTFSSGYSWQTNILHHNITSKIGRYLPSMENTTGAAAETKCST